MTFVRNVRTIGFVFGGASQGGPCLGSRACKGSTGRGRLRAARERLEGMAFRRATSRSASFVCVFICVAALPGCASTRAASDYVTVSGELKAPSLNPAESSGAGGRLLPSDPSCLTASPVYLESQGPVVRATSGPSFRVAGLIQSGSVPPRIGDVKIVWRVTGDGSLSLQSTGPDGHRGTLSFGPEVHGGSSFEEPGTEWGSGFNFDSAGCWTILVTRGQRSSAVTLAIDS
jgi:hypothetical protein